MDWRIVPFDIRYAAAAAKLESMCFSAPWSRTLFEQESRNPLAVMHCALDAEKKLLGWAGFEHVLNEGSITNVAVMPNRRRIGIGRALMRSLIEKARDLSLESLTLEVRASNIAAIELYRQMGFSLVGIRPDYYDFPDEDAVMMRCVIGQKERQDENTCN
jgi:ribosomal-protein-alanine N-acetyltransferase